MSAMEMLAVIPARGGSKRLPRKNILPFRGRPVMAYTIAAALEAGCFRKVLVSTEDDEIAAVGRQYGAEVARRPWALASDTARVVDVCRQVLDEERRAGRRYDVLCCLYATAPLRTAPDILATAGLLMEGECEFAMAVTRYSFPPAQALRPDNAGILNPVWPELVHQQSQNLGTFLVDNGSTYAVLVPAFLETGTFYGPTLKGHVMPRLRSVDIDDEEDFQLALLLAGQGGS
ncbi:MAG: acylneuraminate cytidylyltransferase family protein [Thermodesulfobacteriota bacterium]